MGSHGCPIEPSDWTDCPNDEPDCPLCDGLGTVFDEDNCEVICDRCGGIGFVEYEPFDDDVL